MSSLTSGFVIWNSGSISSPNFVPKEIYPPALQVAELTETVYGTYAEAQAAITAHGGPHNYSTVGAAGLKTGTGAAIQAAGKTGQATNISQFLGKLGEANLWLRILEVALGVTLIAVGLAKITHAVPIATRIAEAIP